MHKPLGGLLPAPSPLGTGAGGGLMNRRFLGSRVCKPKGLVRRKRCDTTPIQASRAAKSTISGQIKTRRQCFHAAKPATDSHETPPPDGEGN